MNYILSKLLHCSKKGKNNKLKYYKSINYDYINYDDQLNIKSSNSFVLYFLGLCKVNLGVLVGKPRSIGR